MTAMLLDQWMRGDPYKLWGETIGHSTKKNLPTGSDLWRYFKDGRVDENLMSHVSDFFDAQGLSLIHI